MIVTTCPFGRSALVTKIDKLLNVGSGSILSMLLRYSFLSEAIAKVIALLLLRLPRSTFSFAAIQSKTNVCYSFGQEFFTRYSYELGTKIGVKLLRKLNLILLSNLCIESFDCRR